MTQYSRDALRKLLAPLAEECARLPLDASERAYFQRATPLYDSRRDSVVSNLGSFEPARAAVAAIDRIQAQYGEAEAKRIALKFAFEILASEDAVAALDPTIDRLCQEIEAPDWTWFGVANLRNVQGEDLAYRLDKETTIQGRDPTVFEGMGIPGATRVLEDEWDRGGFGSYVLIVQASAPKTPENTVESGPDLWERAQRALLTLRLAGTGDVTIGTLFYFRRTPFEFSLGGLSSSAGAMSPRFGFGTTYALSGQVISEYRRIAAVLAKFDASPEKAKRKVARALMYFSSIYDRAPHAPDRFVDSISALEAVFGSDSESAFKLAFRLACLLGTDDSERSTLFNFFRAAYDARSKVVHGDEIKTRHAEILQQEEALRAHTRKILLGCLTIASAMTIEALVEGLDARLLNSGEREKIRRELWPESG
jgi:hypothetical protein